MAPSNATVEAKTNASRQVRPRRLAMPKARSRITNGSSILPHVDHRSLWVRRYKDLISLHLSDLGGEDACSESEKAIVRRCACLMVELERREMIFAQNGEATDNQLQIYQMTSNSLRRLLESLGLQRRAKPVPSLAEYLAAKQRETEPVSEAAE